MTDFLISLYPWAKAFHIMSVISWMAGLFYLPRLFVHHVEQASENPEMAKVFRMMEAKLQLMIMYPAMIATWAFGLMLVFIPGIVDWSETWPWIKAASVVAMTWFHMWLGARRRELANGQCTVTGRQFRLMNEVPTGLMAVIVLSVILKF
jgi:putative membrane protein